MPESGLSTERGDTDAAEEAPRGDGAGPEGARHADERRFYGEILLAFGLVVGALFLYQTAFILKPFALALLFGLALEPAVDRLARWRLNRYLAAVLVVALAVSVVGLLVAVISPVVADQVRLLVDQGPDLIRRATDAVDRLAHRFPAIGEYVSGRVAVGPLLGRLGEVFPLVGQVFGTVTRIAVDTILVMFLLVFGLGRPQPIQGFLRQVVPARFAPQAERVRARVVPQLQSWVIGLVFAMLAIGLLTLVGLLLVGVQYAFAFAVLAGFLEVVPFVGPVLSAVLPAVVTAADDPTKALYVILLFVGIQQIENHVLIPLVMGKVLDLHPVLIMFLVLVMTYYLGVFGTFVAVPTAVLLVVLYEEVYLPRAHPGLRSPG